MANRDAGHYIAGVLTGAIFGHGAAKHNSLAETLAIAVLVVALGVLLSKLIWRAKC